MSRKVKSCGVGDAGSAFVLVENDVRWERYKLQLTGGNPTRTERQAHEDNPVKEFCIESCVVEGNDHGEA